MLSSEQKLLNKIDKAQAKKEKIQRSGKRQVEPNLLNISNTLDAYYFLSKLKNYCAYLDYKMLISNRTIPYKESDFKLMDAIITEIEQQNLENSPLLNIYNQIRLLYASFPDENSSSVNFNKLLSNVEQSVLTISLDEGVEIYSYLSNYCIRQQHLGKETFSLNLFKVYNAMLNLKNQKSRTKILINHGIFKNIVKIALYLKTNPIFKEIQTFGLHPEHPNGYKDAFEWIIQFIDFYQYRIEKKDRLVYVNYCRAAVAFEQKDFEKANRILQQPHHIHGMFINFDTKMLYLKILFELFVKQNSNVLDKTIRQLLESYRGLLKDEQKKKRQLLSKHYNYYHTFYKCYEQLYKLSAYRHMPPFQKDFQSELKNIPYPFKTWFLKKLNGLGTR